MTLAFLVLFGLAQLGISQEFSGPMSESSAIPRADDNPALKNLDDDDSDAEEDDLIEAALNWGAPKNGVPWLPPNYKGQEKSLGYVENAFAVPKGFEDRVQFWVRVYTTITTQQGLLHDSRNVNAVYETLDFSDIYSSPILSEKQKRKEKKKRIDSAKAQIKDRLLKLSKLNGPEGLEGEDLRYWNLFAGVSEENRFSQATERKRIRFQLGQKDRFQQAIWDSGKYLSHMESIFSNHGLPIELTRLPFVESSFNYKARSRVGASGIWQIMRYSTKRMLKMDATVDERNDPLKATRTAARILQVNYDMLREWPLAVTGYNHGPMGVQRMVQRFKTPDIVELTDQRHGRFGFASANFYASFLAAVEVEKNADKYFGTGIMRAPPIDAIEIKLEKPVLAKVILSWFDNKIEFAEELNPHVRPHAWKGNSQILAGSFVRIPKAKELFVMEELKRGNASKRLAASESVEIKEGQGISPPSER